MCVSSLNIVEVSAFSFSIIGVRFQFFFIVFSP